MSSVPFQPAPALTTAPAPPLDRKPALSRSHGNLAWLLMGLHVSCSAGTHLLSKAAVTGFGSPEALTFVRACAAALVVLALTGTLIGRPRFTRGEWGRVCVLGVMLVANQYFYVRGLTTTVPSHPALFYALTPLGVLLLSSLLRRSMPAALVCAGVVLAFAGVLCVLRPWESHVNSIEMRSGDLWVLAAVLIWVFYTVYAEPLLKRHDSRIVTAWSLVIGALAFLPVGASALSKVDTSKIAPTAWIGLTWMVLITSIGMMLLWNTMLRILEPVKVAICANAQPPATVALSAGLTAAGILQLPQDVGKFFWIGMAMVLLGLMLVQKARRVR